MSEVEVYKSRLERTVKIQLASEGRPYSRKDVLDVKVIKTFQEKDRETGLASNV